MNALPKFNPFDRKSASIRPPVEVQSVNWDGYTHRTKITLRVADTNSGHASVTKNYVVGATITIDKKPMVVTAMRASSREEGVGIGYINVEVEAVEVKDLLRMAAGHAERSPANPDVEVKASEPILPPTHNARKLIL